MWYFLWGSYFFWSSLCGINDTSLLCASARFRWYQINKNIRFFSPCPDTTLFCHLQTGVGGGSVSYIFIGSILGYMRLWGSDQRNGVWYYLFVFPALNILIDQTFRGTTRCSCGCVADKATTHPRSNCIAWPHP